MSRPSAAVARLAGTPMLGSAMNGPSRSGTTEANLEIRSPTEHCRFQFIVREHQRRHVEGAVENVANRSLAADRHPLPYQVGDIARSARINGLTMSLRALEAHGVRDIKTFQGGAILSWQPSR
jgi:hypothetical protein